jgi:hypothetical protein
MKRGVGVNTRQQRDEESGDGNENAERKTYFEQA